MKKKITAIIVVLIGIVSAVTFGTLNVEQIDANTLEENKLVNGNFEEGTTNWFTLHEFGGEADFSVNEGGVAEVEIVNIGTQIHPDWGIPISWTTQLVQDNVAIESGYTYSLSFDASSTQPRPIEVEFTGLSGADNVSFTIDETMQTYTHELDYNFQSTDIALKFLIGTVGEVDGLETPDTGHTISFDNISLRPVRELDESSDDAIDWTLSWSDEFDGDALDLTNWRYDEGNYMQSTDGEWVAGWGNEESQYYQSDNVRVQDGHLIIEAKEESVTDEHDTYDYTSGKIMSDGLFSQTYGRFEARMKLPEGQGFWPAFWLMPQDDVYGGWASSGEIDIMENRGDQLNTVGAAVHYGGGWPNNVHSGGEYHFPEGSSITDFNVYSLEWEPGELRWYVNDELYYQTSDWFSDNGEYPAPFDQDFFIILNLAVGGWYGLEPNENTPFPSQVEVDYVRVYEGEYNHDVTPPEPEPSDPEEEEPPFIQVNPDDYRSLGENLLLDANFDAITTENLIADDTAWGIHNQGVYEDWAGLATFEIHEGILTSQIEQLGWEWWHIQLHQTLSIPNGTYLLSFDAASENPRDLYIEFPGTQTGILNIPIDGEMDAYHYLLYFGEDVPETQLLFGFGRDSEDEEFAVPYNVSLDNVRLIPVEAIEHIEEDEMAELEERIAELEAEVEELTQNQAVQNEELTALREKLEVLRQTINKTDQDAAALLNRITLLEVKLLEIEESAKETEKITDSETEHEEESTEVIVEVDDGNDEEPTQSGQLSNETAQETEEDDLPATGEYSNTWMYLIGSLLVISGLVFIVRLRKETTE